MLHFLLCTWHINNCIHVCVFEFILRIARQIIRCRGTATYSRQQTKQGTAQKRGIQNQRKHHMIWSKYEEGSSTFTMQASKGRSGSS